MTEEIEYRMPEKYDADFSTATPVLVPDRQAYINHGPKVQIMF